MEEFDPPRTMREHPRLREHHAQVRKNWRMVGVVWGWFLAILCVFWYVGWISPADFLWPLG